MKRIVLLMIIWLLVGYVHAMPSLPTHATINFALTKIERAHSCPTILNNAKVVVDYDYNFERNIGLAHLKQLQSTSWGQVLHPLGLSDYYAFMSDMKPTAIHLDRGVVTIYRIIFHLYRNGDSKVLMMIGPTGECIMSTNVVNVMS